MTIRPILTAAKGIVERDHAQPPGLARDAQGNTVRPLDPEAVAWTTVGALIRVAPHRLPKREPDLTAHGHEALELLEQAAWEQGFTGPTAVDRAGVPFVMAMFERAFRLCPDEGRRR